MNLLSFNMPQRRSDAPQRERQQAPADTGNGPAASRERMTRRLLAFLT
jgi:hypothetical protein